MHSKYRKVVFHWHIQPYGLKFKCNIFSPLIFLAVEQFLCFTLILLVCKISCLSSIFCHLVLFPWWIAFYQRGWPMCSVISMAFSALILQMTLNIFVIKVYNIQVPFHIDNNRTSFFFESKIHIKSSFLLIFMEAKTSYWWILVISEHGSKQLFSMGFEI